MIKNSKKQTVKIGTTTAPWFVINKVNILVAVMPYFSGYQKFLFNFIRYSSNVYKGGGKTNKNQYKPGHSFSLVNSEHN